MKVSYETNIDRGEPVAHLEKDGTLVFKDTADNEMLYVTSEGKCGYCADFDTEYIVKAFYKGDTITITF